MKNLWTRIVDELSQAWIVTLKDIKVYYLRPGMIMFGFLMPFFMFFSFSRSLHHPHRTAFRHL
jgi:hypothetical protein